MNLVKDLRRRRVFRLAGLYIVGAWLVIEVASIFFPAWGIPETALRYLFIAAALIFPVALVFGWFFDITPDGIVRTRDAKPGDQLDLSLKRVDYAILVAIAGVAVVVLLGSLDKITEQIDTSPATQLAAERVANSIAILPFVNLDANRDTEYFSDGVTEEILHRLSSSKALQVIGRTSSFAFRNSEDGPARISEILGVAYLLHGSVRRDGDFVRVTARLLDHSGFQVWSQSFDRQLEGIFVIQSEIASTVTNEIVQEIVPLNEQPVARTTQNMEAYNDYLVGRAYVNSRVAGWQNQAIESFSAAIEKDPDFAPPYAGIAVALSITAPNSDDRWDEAERMVKNALQLDPELAEAHAALGLFHLTRPQPDFEASINALQRAIEFDPSIPIAYNWLASSLNELGRNAESDAVQDKGLEVDPLNPSLTVNVANRYKRLGDFDRAEQLMRRLTHLPEPPGIVLWELHSFYTDLGRLDEALHWIKEVNRAYAGTGNENGLSSIAWAYARLGMMDDAEYWLGQVEKHIRNPFALLGARGYLARLTGRTEELRFAVERFEQTMPAKSVPPVFNLIVGASWGDSGDYERAAEYFERRDSENASPFTQVNTIDELKLLHSVVWTYRRLGKFDLAEEILNTVGGRIREFEQNNMMHVPEMLEVAAIHQVMRGDLDRAQALLQRAYEQGWKNVIWVRNDPVWKTVIDHPGIATILKRAQADLDVMRSEVELQEETSDFREEISRVYATAAQSGK